MDNQLSKTKVEEGKDNRRQSYKNNWKIYFYFCAGLKSEPVIDVNELKSINKDKEIKVGDKISVLLEKIEDKNGNVVVSATKAQKIQGWHKLEKAYEEEKPIMVKLFLNAKVEWLLSI